MRAIATSVICLSVCVLRTAVSHTKTTEPMQMPFGGRLVWSHVTVIGVHEPHVGAT